MRAFPNLVVDDPSAVATFYETHFGLRRAFTSDWYVQLAEAPADGPPDGDGAEPRIVLGLLARPTELLPLAAQGPADEAFSEAARAQGQASPPGVLLTFRVDDVDAWLDGAADRAAAAGLTAPPVVVEPLQDRFYGQRGALVVDPAGTLLDVCSPCEPDPAWAARLTRTDDGWHEAPAPT